MSVGIYKNGKLVKTAGMSSGYENFTPATATTNGASGLVWAPLAGDQEKFLRGDGKWVETQETIGTIPDSEIIELFS